MFRLFSATNSSRRYSDLLGTTQATALLVVGLAFTVTYTALPAFSGEQKQLVAIDVLLEPDGPMLEVAERWNTRLREQMPDGFALDDAHRPHITLLQQYVDEKDVAEIVAAVKALKASENLTGMTLTANGLYHIPTGNIGLQGITIKSSKEILALQAKVMQTMAPYRKSGGDQAAFVPDPTGAPFDPILFDYVGTFVEKQTGTNYNPHVTTGTGPLDWVEQREAEPFNSFEFGIKSLAVYQLGNFGTASKRLSE